MLPDFPSIKHQRARLYLRAAYMLALKKHGVLSQIDSQPIPEGNDLRAKSVGGILESEGFVTLSTHTELSLHDLPTLNEQGWIKFFHDSVAIPIIEQQSKYLFEQLNKITAATGNVIDAKGKPFSEDLILQCLEQVGLSFGEDGMPQFPALVVGTELFDRIKSMEPSNEFKERQADLVERQRIEWRFDQADRKLAD